VTEPERPRPGLARRAAAGAWHVPAGFGFVLARPRLWALAALPAGLAVALVFLGLVLGVFAGPLVEARLAPAPGSVPVFVELPLSLLLWTATLGSGAFLGLGVALALVSPVLEQLSQRVEARARGRAAESGRGVTWEVAQAIRGSLYFLVAAPFVFLLGLIPVVGPFLSLAFGGRALAHQMTDPSLARRGLSFPERRHWHRRWRAESVGFGLAGMVGLLVPLANLFLGPALVAGGTLLVLDLEGVEKDRPQPEPPPFAGTDSRPGAESATSA
jgi:CysZ protein